MLTYTDFVKSKPVFVESDIAKALIIWGDNYESFPRSKVNIVKVYRNHRQTEEFEFKTWIEVYRFIEGFQWVK